MLRRKVDYVRRIFYMPDYFRDLRVNDTDVFYDILNKSRDELNNEISIWGRIIGLLSFSSSICVVILNISTTLIFGVKVINGIITLGTFTMLYSGTQKLFSSLTKFFFNHTSFISK